MPLFNLSYDELREAFVLARLAQDDVFGRPNIEEWLLRSTHRGDDPNNSTAEWEAGAFTQYFEMNCGHKGARTFADWIRKNATPLAEPYDHFLAGLDYARTFYVLLDVLRLGGAEIYYGWSRKHDSRSVLIIDNHAFVAEFKKPRTVLTPREAPILVLREATILDVQRILLAEVMDNRPKRDRALTWLSDNYQQAIRNTRTMARADFNEAVAVSADGTKIVKADWVVMTGLDVPTSSSANHNVVVFPGTAFRNKKILRSDRMVRSKFSDALVRGFEEAPLEERIARAASLNLQEQFCATSGSQTLCFGGSINPPSKYPVFFTTPDFCSSTLPEGGREICI